MDVNARGAATKDCCTMNIPHESAASDGLARSRRVVITGIGAITPLGIGKDALWCGVRRGESAVRPVTRFDASPFATRIAAEVNDFDALDYLYARHVRCLDRYV